MSNGIFEDEKKNLLKEIKEFINNDNETSFKRNISKITNENDLRYLLMYSIEHSSTKWVQIILSENQNMDLNKSVKKKI